MSLLLRECLATSDSSLSSFRTRIRAYGTTRRVKTRLSRPFSFIRTLTVGFGIAPNLLTLVFDKQGARGLGPCDPSRRWGLSPRPENIGSPTWAACSNYARAIRLRQA